MQYPLWYNEYASLPSRIITSLCGDTYALLEDYYLQGGYRVCATREERNLISYDKRKVGMMVYVVSGTTSGGTYFSGNTFWMLNNEPVADPVPPYEYDPTNETPTEDSDWTQLCLFCTTPPPPGPYWTVTPSSREIPTDGTWTADFTVNFYNWTLPTVWWITEPPAGSTFTLSDGTPYYLNLYSGSTDGSTFKASGTTMTYDKGYRDATIVVWATGLTNKTVQIYQNPLDYNAPYFTLFQFATPHLYEVGTTVPTKVATWANTYSENVQTGTMQINAGDGLSSAVVGLSPSSPNNNPMSQTITFDLGELVRTTPGTKGPWTISAIDIKGTSFSKINSTIEWKYPVFWGKKMLFSLTETDILSLEHRDLIDPDGNYPPGYVFNTNYEFGFICYYNGYNRVSWFEDLRNPGMNFGMLTGYPNQYTGYKGKMSYDLVTMTTMVGSPVYRVYRSANRNITMGMRLILE